MSVPHARYTSVAIILHWVMAVAFLLMLASGFSMEYLKLDKAFQFQLFQWHKSLGVLLLAAFVLRIGWRLTHVPPESSLPVPAYERAAAKAGHWLLYACMLVMPFTGWLMVSASVYGLPTIVFGWFEWPHIPNLSGNEAVGGAAGSTHAVVAWAFSALIAGHVLAVVKHAVIDKQNLLTRMWWTKGQIP